MSHSGLARFLHDFVWLTPSDVFWPAITAGIILPVAEITGEAFFDTGTRFASYVVAGQVLFLLVALNGYRRSQKRRRQVRENGRDRWAAGNSGERK